MLWWGSQGPFCWRIQIRKLSWIPYTIILKIIKIGTFFETRACLWWIFFSKQKFVKYCYCLNSVDCKFFENIVWSSREREKLRISKTLYKPGYSALHCTKKFKVSSSPKLSIPVSFWIDSCINFRHFCLKLQHSSTWRTCKMLTCMLFGLFWHHYNIL